MAAMTSSPKHMDQLISRLRFDYPSLTFVAGSTACWFPRGKTITYTNTAHGTADILHELAHALLEHQDYKNDVDLLTKEVAAWDKTLKLAAIYGASIDHEYVQDCLDTYRNWAHTRSTCPACTSHGLQATPELYNCLNCAQTWYVSAARLKRPYRLSAYNQK